MHVSHVEDRAIGRRFHVLRHTGRIQREAPQQFLRRYIHLDHGLAELAARDQEAAVGGEVHVVHALARHPQLVRQLHSAGVVELQPFALFATTMAYLPSGV